MPPGCHLFTGMCQFLLSLCGFLKSFFRVKLTHCQALTEERCSGKACSFVCSIWESRPPSNFNQFPQWAVAGFWINFGELELSRFLWFISSASAHVSGVVIFWHIGRICHPWAPPPISLLPYYWINARYSTEYNAVYRHLIDIFQLKCMVETARALFDNDKSDLI